MLGNSRSAKRAAIGSRHIVASDKTIVIGVGLLVAALALGGGLADNRAGTGIDRWFQRITAAGAVRPGQPGFHYRLFVTLTHSVELGRFPEVAYVVTAVVAILFAVAAQRGCRLRDRRIVVASLCPVLALVVGTGSGELVKLVVDRRMVGNLGVMTYPSGHAVATASVAAATIVALRALDGRGYWRRLPGVESAIAVLLVLMSLTVSVDMAILRAHFLTDVLGGWCWGGGWGLLLGTWSCRGLTRSYLETT